MIKALKIYVPPEMLHIADNQPTHFLANVRATFQNIGLKVSFETATKDVLDSSYQDDAYCLFYRDRPTHHHALELRPAPFGPFWMIDKTGDPAEKTVFKRSFHPEKVNPDLATSFFQRMTDRHKTAKSSNNGFVLIAMQGVIGRQRFWQSMTPLDMVRETIAHEPNRKIYVKLHPRETYSHADLSALNDLMDGDRVQLVDGDLEQYLSACDYTVSMNSSVSLKGLLYHKRGILFGEAEFHHIFQSVQTKGVANCFADVLTDMPAIERYVFWYLRRQHLWNFSKTIEDDILKRCRALGWAI